VREKDRSKGRWGISIRRSDYWEGSITEREEGEESRVGRWRKEKRPDAKRPDACCDLFSLSPDSKPINVRVAFLPSKIESNFQAFLHRHLPIGSCAEE